MLNELSALRNSLSARGVLAGTWHSWIKPFRKGVALVAPIGPTGTLECVSSMAVDEVTALRNIAPDNQNSFPGFNLNCPLLDNSDASLWNQPEKLWILALEGGGCELLAYKPKDFRRLGRLLTDFPAREIEPRLRHGGSKLGSTLALLARLAETRQQPQTFLHQLAVELVRGVKQGRLSQELALAVLFGKADKKKQKLEAWSVTLILDVSDLGQFSHRVADSAVPREWSAALFASESDSKSTIPSESVICGLTGRPDAPAGAKLPNPTLKVLGPTYLMAMNDDTPCQTRYGKTGTDVFPVGKTSVQGLSDAIRFITEASRRGKTWGAVPNGARDKNDLLIAYLEDEPDGDLPIARLFLDDEPDAGDAEVAYEVRTQDVFNALRRHDVPGMDRYIHLIAISAIDKGRRQVVFNSRYSARAVYAGRDKWLAGSRNSPPIVVTLPAGKGKPAERHDSFSPSPAQVMSSFRKQWLKSGQASKPTPGRDSDNLKPNSVPGVDLGRIYALMLDPDAADQAQWLLERYLPLTTPLLIGLGGARSGGSSISVQARKDALVAIATLGILLYRQGRHKETYMQSRDYLLGAVPSTRRPTSQTVLHQRKEGRGPAATDRECGNSHGDSEASACD